MNYYNWINQQYTAWKKTGKSAIAFQKMDIEEVRNRKYLVAALTAHMNT